MEAFDMYVKQAERLGLSGDDVVKYVQQCRDRDERRQEREEKEKQRAFEQEEKNKELEREEKQKQRTRGK